MRMRSGGIERRRVAARHRSRGGLRQEGWPSGSGRNTLIRVFSATGKGRPSRHWARPARERAKPMWSQIGDRLKFFDRFFPGSSRLLHIFSIARFVLFLHRYHAMITYNTQKSEIFWHGLLNRSEAKVLSPVEERKLLGRAGRLQEAASSTAGPRLTTRCGTSPSPRPISSN